MNDKNEYDRLEENPSQDKDLDGFVVNDAEPLEIYHSPSSQTYESSGSVADSQSHKRNSSTKTPSNNSIKNKLEILEEEEDEKTIAITTSNLWSNQTDRQSFEIYLQFMISAVLDPQFVSSVEQKAETSSYFLPPKTRIESKINDFKRYLCRSSLWKDYISIPIESLPELSKQKSADPVLCQVCERTNHPSKFIISLSGNPYDSELLWNRSVVDLEDEAHEEFKTKFQEKSFFKLIFAGQYCAGRVSIYHKLHHYKYRLVTSIKVNCCFVWF